VSQDRAQEYRRSAAQCLSMAAKADAEENKKRWLGLASQWQRLAVEADGAPRFIQQAQPDIATASVMVASNSFIAS
jgi:hypothetical protein